MAQVIFTFALSILFIAGSTQIDNVYLSWAQFIAGAWFAFAGAYLGWRLVNK